jgi:glutaredoxin
MKITVYSTTNCGICHTLMQWLDKQSKPYTKHIVDQDPQAMTDFMHVNDGMIGTPFTVIENAGQTTKIAGFDQAKFKKALSIA